MYVMVCILSPRAGGVVVSSFLLFCPRPITCLIILFSFGCFEFTKQLLHRKFKNVNVKSAIIIAVIKVNNRFFFVIIVQPYFKTTSISQCCFNYWYMCKTVLWWYHHVGMPAFIKLFGPPQLLYLFLQPAMHSNH